VTDEAGSHPPAQRPGPVLPERVCWSDDGCAVIILDQTALPAREVRRELSTIDEVEEAIRSLRVRGAPLIGVTAALAVVALVTRAVAEQPSLEAGHLAGSVQVWCARLGAARPTAVNLGWAMARMRAAAEVTLATPSAASGAVLAEALRHEAVLVETEDRDTCRLIGEHALALLEPRARVLTHCNAGALATTGIGTALAPLYLAHEAGWPIEVFVGETRPLLQGSRLTAWELTRAGVDVTILTDGMAGALFATRRPDLVVVGADRIAANGDVANKIGTYTLAVLARHHGVPFYVLAPTSTIDLETTTGGAIPIEARGPEEVSRGFGRRTAPDRARVWNPAFDVTPADLVTAIVTEWGIARPPLATALRDAVERARVARAAARTRTHGASGGSSGRTGR
jgi:methylthioribose-1-phosphate isomerase